MTELLTCELDGGGGPLVEQVAGAAVVGAIVGDGHTSQPQLVRVPHLGYVTIENTNKNDSYLLYELFVYGGPK